MVNAKFFKILDGNALINTFTKGFKIKQSLQNMRAIAAFAKCHYRS